MEHNTKHKQEQLHFQEQNSERVKGYIFKVDIFDNKLVTKEDNKMKITPQNSINLKVSKETSEQQSKSQIFITNKILPVTRSSTKLTNHTLDRTNNSNKKINETKQEIILRQSTTNLDYHFCNICQTSKSKEQMVIFSDCLHVFCYECTYAYITARMQQNLPLNCCQQSCPLVLNTQINPLLQKNIPMFVKKIPKQTKNQIKNYLKRNRQLPKKCEKCTYKNNVKKDLMKKCQQCIKQEVVLPDGHKKCRNCWKIIEKQKGCDHVKCPCGFQFCFKCEEEWKVNHICEDRFPQRDGLCYAVCLILKIPIYVTLAIPLLLLFVLFSIFICLLSASLLGVYSYFKLIETVAKLQEIGNCLKFFLFVLSLIISPVIIAIFIIPGFFIPLINLFYKQNIFLNPKILPQLAESMFGCILMLRLL